MRDRAQDPKTVLKAIETSKSEGDKASGGRAERSQLSRSTESGELDWGGGQQGVRVPGGKDFDTFLSIKFCY